MATTTNSGEIITFYSYKGGVGRTFTLANVASLLVHWGYKVLCIDWDIEAPGLHYYFPPPKAVEKGLYELMRELGTQSDQWQKFVRTVNIPRSGRRIDIMYASGEKDGIVDPIDWVSLYDVEDFGARLEAVRAEWKREYDFVLIDSRTGVTDSGAICTAQLPDTLIFLLTANDQSLRGSVRVIKRAIRARQRLPIERSALRTFPIISRFDTREEYELAVNWKERLGRELREFYESWTPSDIVASSLREQTTVPYIARWSFGEEIVGRRERDSPDFISYYFTNIASIVANRFEHVETLIGFRESFVAAAQGRGRSSPKLLYDVYFSAGRELNDLSTRIGKLLGSAGYRVFPQRPKRGKEFVEQINDGLSQSRNLVFLIGNEISPGQLDELVYFMRQSAATNFDRRILPVYMSEKVPRDLPNLIQNFVAISGFKASDQILAGKIAAHLSASDNALSRKAPPQ